MSVRAHVCVCARVHARVRSCMWCVLVCECVVLAPRQSSPQRFQSVHAGRRSPACPCQRLWVFVGVYMYVCVCVRARLRVCAGCIRMCARVSISTRRAEPTIDTALNERESIGGRTEKGGRTAREGGRGGRRPLLTLEASTIWTHAPKKAAAVACSH